MKNTPYRRQYDENGQVIKETVHNLYPNRRARNPRKRRSSKLTQAPGVRVQWVPTWLDKKGKVLSRSERHQSKNEKFEWRKITHEKPDNGQHPIYDTMVQAAIGHGNKGIDPREPHRQYDKVRRPIPKGARKWPAYGSVVALNEENAIRKHHSIISKHPEL